MWNPSIFNPAFMEMGGLSATALVRLDAAITGNTLFIHREGEDDIGGGPISSPPFSRSDAFSLDEIASDISRRLAQLRYNNGVSTLADEEAPQIWDALRDWFRERIQASGANAGEIKNDAKLALDTLDEIVLLKETENFFSDGIAGFNEFLSKIGHDYDEFGPFLFARLETYRRERDKAEEKFLVPYRGACKELEGIISDVREHLPFTLFKMKSRIKENTLLKMRVRGFKNMNEIYDLAGIRILVGCHEEVPAAVAVIQGALMATRANLSLHDDESPDSERPHYFRPLTPDVKDKQEKYKERGYRATHIDVDQVYADESSIPIAEIQMMSVGMMIAGGIQYDATYKSVLSTEDMKTVYDYYAQGIGFVLDRESGRSSAARPTFDSNLLFEIRQPEARTCMRRQHQKMERLMDLYERFPGYSPEWIKSSELFKPVHDLFP